MTTRKSFLAALTGFLGIARAQVPQSHENLLGTPWDTRKPKNRECPVCGTMAKPYKTIHDCFGPVNMKDGSMKFVDCEPQRLIRCERCSNAFFQDAEK
jgi:rubredoxin